MKLVTQRVRKASVTVDKRIVGKIGSGYLVLLGVKEGDSEKKVDTLVNKLVKLRLMADKNGKMNLSVKDVGGEVLVISQFTLYANTNKGNRPSFIKAAKPELAEKLYQYFIETLRNQGIKVESGKFGALMVIDAELDGPVTIELES